MNFKLILLYILLVIFISFTCFSLYMCIPKPQPEIEEEPSEYSEMQAEKIIVTNEKRMYDFSSLSEQNEDTVCWLRIPQTEISYPVVLGDDNSFYLNHSFSKEYSQYGCPFLDTRTPVTGDNIVIHGHNMGNNRTEMFSSLLLFQDQDYASKHNKICLAFPLEEEEREYTVFAVSNFDISDMSFDYIRSEFETEDEREEFVSFLKSKTLYQPGNNGATEDGQILILSTCNRMYGEDNRLLICAFEKR